MGTAVGWVLDLLLDDEFDTILPARDVQDVIEARRAHKNQTVLNTITGTRSWWKGRQFLAEGKQSGSGCVELSLCVILRREQFISAIVSQRYPFPI